MDQDDERKVKEDNTAENAVERAFDPTSLFEHDKTKKLMFRETPKIAKLSQPNVRLIDTTAALFLQNLVSTAKKSAMDGEEEEEQSVCITSQDLMSAISSNESLHFLKPALESTISSSKRAEAPYVSAKEKKRKRQSTTEQNSERIKKAKSFLGKHKNDEETLGVALDVSDEIVADSNAGPTTEIVPDEDDYD